LRRWIIALLVTLAAATYQRVTGPTHPVRGAATLDGDRIKIRLTRTHGGDGDQLIRFRAPPSVEGDVEWRYYPTDDPFNREPLSRDGDALVARLPHQPPAGKLEYRILLRSGASSAALPARGTVVTRFKGGVPPWVLIPHVLGMFLGMLWSNRAGIEAIQERRRERNGRKLQSLTTISFLLLGVGGMILGPVVQKYAFGAFWTGVPFGWDLTDNKTLIAFLAWLLGLIAIRRNPRNRRAVLVAAIVTLAVFLIPHSMFGSELER
jgi:hypothetical protein